MKFIADLHTHSKYARACSPALTLENIDAWCRVKGVDIVSTGDFTHTKWFAELKEKLVPSGREGLYVLRDGLVPTVPPPIAVPKKPTLFMVGTELACIYSQGARPAQGGPKGKVRRVHLCVYAPSLEVAGKINVALTKRGCKLGSDGRAIIGMSSKELLRIILEIDPRCVMIPAHCLLPGSLVHTKERLLTPIEKIKKSEHVLTHTGKWCRVEKVLQRSFSGNVYNIQPYYFRAGLTTTPEHPFFAIKTQKNCHWSKGICKPSHAILSACTEKYFSNYRPTWIPAASLEKGDVLVFPRFLGAFKGKTGIDLGALLLSSGWHMDQKYITPIGSRGMAIKRMVKIDAQFCRLMGYYLAEGHTNGRDAIGFTFHRKEKKYLQDVIGLLKEVFDMKQIPKIRLARGQSSEVVFYSKILQEVFQKLCYSPGAKYDASTKMMPEWMLGLAPELQCEIMRGWWRGDKGYTSSRMLMNQMKIIFLRLGIVPSIYEDTVSAHTARGRHNFQGRTITAKHTNYCMIRLAFFEDTYGLLKEKEFSAFKIKSSIRHGWIDQKYIYLPIRDITTRSYKGQVYNLEVEGDNSYVSEFATVHNCWTPWFAVFGSNSGFDSLEECFEELAPHIFAIETGLSSDPPMNWRVRELDNIALVSFADAHSLPNLGREATVFEGSEKDLSYDNIMNAIRNASPVALSSQTVIPERRRGSTTNAEIVDSRVRGNDKIVGLKMSGTIEFIPDEGKYHYDGHRSCKVCLHPSKTKKLGGICPKCKKPVTVGVLSRVEELANEPVGRVPKHRPQFWSLVELDKIIAEAEGIKGRAAKKVEKIYWELVSKAGTELNLLLNMSAREIAAICSPRMAEAIRRMREGKVKIDPPGYDGEYGVVNIFSEKEKAEAKQSLF